LRGIFVVHHENTFRTSQFFPVFIPSAWPQLVAARNERLNRNLCADFVVPKGKAVWGLRGILNRGSTSAFVPKVKERNCEICSRLAIPLHLFSHPSCSFCVGGIAASLLIKFYSHWIYVAKNIWAYGTHTSKTIRINKIPF